MEYLTAFPWLALSRTSVKEIDFGSRLLVTCRHSGIYHDSASFFNLYSFIFYASLLCTQLYKCGK